MKTIVIISLVILSCCAAFSQPPDSCLKLFIIPDPTFINPDSVKVDSCFESVTYGDFYAKQFFWIRFKYNVLPRSKIYPPDTIIEYKWSDMDTLYQDTRDGFQQMEQKYGNLWLRERLPGEADTTKFIQRFLLLRFEDYINIDSVANFVSDIALVSFSYYIIMWGVLSGISDISITDFDLKTSPNPFSNSTTINYTLNDPSQVSINVYNNLGQEITTLVDGFREAGEQQAIFIGDNLSPGVYYYTIRIGRQINSGKLLLIR